MLEYSDIPNSERKSKNLIFELLSKNSPLTIAALQAGLKDSYRIKMTYQAVRKAVGELKSRKVVVHGAQGYSLNQAWLLRTKRMIDQLLAEQQRKSGKAYGRLLSDDFSSYQLESLFELDNFWCQILEHGVQRMSGASSKQILCVNHYCWWMLINFGQETSLYRSFVERGCEVKVLILHDLPINRWVARIYREVGALAEIRRGAGITGHVDLNILNDTIVQVAYPPTLAAQIEKLLGSSRGFDEKVSRKMARLAHTKAQIRLTAQRDPAMASRLRDYYLTKLGR